MFCAILAPVKHSKTRSAGHEPGLVDTSDIVMTDVKSLALRPEPRLDAKSATKSACGADLSVVFDRRQPDDINATLAIPMSE